MQDKSIYMQIITTSEAFEKGHFNEGVGGQFVALSIISCA